MLTPSSRAASPILRSPITPPTGRSTEFDLDRGPAPSVPFMTMTYRPLGVTGIPVSQLCLGAMMFGDVGGSGAGNPDHAACIEIVHAALDAGINFVDTADMYSAGESEVIVGKALAGRRDDVVLSTKGHFPMGDAPGRSGNSRRWLV